ncbi:hypothetical protein [Simiduia aestuariiviva]|uniref:DUF2846 domain-containing protein n=1 Tax=Simiduia aestuariiviva TaxID=1510459 RepID=A0A839UWI8_9GAMM|nr:hypothetical protein [Simiduia aestuariiviva]MBB3169727.1 hypothetical protein [Simiduia aestuariiviva]
MIKLKFLLAIVLLALSGCTNVSNLPSNYVFSPDSETGILLASVSYHGTYSGYSIKFRKVGGAEWQKIQIGSGTAFLPPGMLDWDIEAPGLRGNVFAIELPEGEYEFASWFVSSGVASIGPVDPFSIRFNIYPGNITYGGGFHFIRESGFGATVTGVNVNYENKYDRDVPIIRKKYRNLDTKLIKNNVEITDPISKLGAGNSTTITPIFIMY